MRLPSNARQIQKQLLLFCYIFIRNEAHFGWVSLFSLYPFSIISSPKQTQRSFDFWFEKSSRKWKNVMNEKRYVMITRFYHLMVLEEKREHIILLDIFHKWADIVLQQWARFRFGGNLIRKHFDFTVPHNYFPFFTSGKTILLKGLKTHALKDDNTALPYR